jgi:hypothetical protein
LRKDIGSVKEKSKQIRTDKENLRIFLFHKVMIVFLSNFKSILKMISENSTRKYTRILE